MNQPYIFLKTLKERADGAVRLVRCRETGRNMVLRQYRGDCSVYRRLMAVDCPHLPKIYRVDEQDGMVTVLEEYIWGDSLEELLQGCPMTPEEAAKIAAQLCAALEVLHGFGAVHRDIKPTNIILREDHAVLIDFDAARIHKEEQSTDTRVMGTTGYAAPEQYGFAQTDARTDIYAMGVLLNVMVTGRHPSKVLVEGRLRKIVETCVQVHADRRYPSAKALAEALTAKKRRVWPWAVVLTAVLLAGGLWLGLDRPGELEVSAPQEPVVPAEPAAEEKTGEIVVSNDLSTNVSMKNCRMPGSMQFDLLLGGEPVAAERISEIFLSDPALGEILSIPALMAEGDWTHGTEWGQWLWVVESAIPHTEGILTAVIDGVPFYTEVSTGDPDCGYYTDPGFSDEHYLPFGVTKLFEYEPGQELTVWFTTFNGETILRAYTDHEEFLAELPEEPTDTVAFTLNPDLTGDHSFRFTVVTNTGIYRILRASLLEKQ